MASIRDRCVAVQNLLLSVQGSPVHLEIARTQHSQLLMAIRAVRLTSAEVADLVTHLNAIVWPEQNMSNELLLAANLASARGRPTARSLNQDYTSVVNYYTRQDWADTTNNGQQNLIHTVLAKPIALGLRNPMEITFQVLAALLLVLQEGGCEKAKQLSPQMKFHMLKFVKQRFRAAAAHAPKIAWIQVLPANPTDAVDMDDFCAVVDGVYDEGFGPIASPFDETLFNSLVMSIPMRSSNAQVRALPIACVQGNSPSPFGGQNMAMQAMMQMMQMFQQQQSGEPRIDINPGSRRPITFVGDEEEQHQQAIVKFKPPAPSPPVTPVKAGKAPAASSPVTAAKADGTRKLTIAEATVKIMKDLGGDAADSDDEEENDDDDDGVVVKGKGKTKVEGTKAKKAPKAQSKAKAKKAPTAKVTAKVIKKKVSASIGNETSRQQVRCRAADGSSFSISYKKVGGEAKALQKAKKWLDEQ